jgi:hypothetical protein
VSAQPAPLPEAMVTLTCKDCLRAIGSWNFRTTHLAGELAKARKAHAIQAHDWAPRRRP